MVLHAETAFQGNTGGHGGKDQTAAEIAKAEAKAQAKLEAQAKAKERAAGTQKTNTS